MEPYTHKSFDSVPVILQHLTAFPEKCKKYGCSIEYFDSPKNFCKIYTKQGMFNYLVVNQDRFINSTLIEKFRLRKAIRKIK